MILGISLPVVTYRPTKYAARICKQAVPKIKKIYSVPHSNPRLKVGPKHFVVLSDKSEKGQAFVGTRQAVQPSKSLLRAEFELMPFPARAERRKKHISTPNHRYYLLPKESEETSSRKST